MALTHTCVKITGNPGPSGWSQVHEYVPEDPEKLALRGSLFAVIATNKHEEGVENVLSGRELLARLHEEYFGKTEGTAFNCLKTAVEKVVEEFQQSWGNVEIAAAVFLKGVLYTAACGGSEVSILRNGTFAKILTSKEGVVSASGYPQGGDTLILGTRSLFSSLATGVIKAAMAAGDLTGVSETLSSQVHSKSGSGNIGAVVIRFSQSNLFNENPPVSSASMEAPPLSKKGLRLNLGFNFKDSFKNKLPSLALLKTSRIALKKPIYVRHRVTDGYENPPDNKRTTIAVAAILLLLLILSIVFGIRQKNLKDQKAAYSEQLAQARHSLDEAISLASISPEKARSLFSESKSIVTQLSQNGVKDPELDQLIGQLESDQQKLMGEYRSEAEQFLDLSLLSSGFMGDQLVASGERFYVLDKQGKKVVKIAYDSKKTEVVAGPSQIQEVETMAAYEDKAFVLNNSGITQVGEGSSKVAEKEWEGSALMTAYAGNIYLIDKTSSSIYRYTGSDAGFSDKREWLAKDVAVNLSQAEKMVIDGSVWVLTSSGKVIRFSQGNQLSFKTEGIYPDLTSIDSLFTNEEAKSLYFLDRQNKRVVVTDKDGKYQAQYIADILADASDLVVSEEHGLLVFLIKDKLYLLQLKHI